MAAKLQYASLDFQNSVRLLNVPDATLPQHPATLAQLTAAVEGIKYKDDVRVYAPANVNLAAPGATIDGVAMVVNDRFAAPNQTTTTERGIYVYNGAATPATRALDANTAKELENAVFAVKEGTSASLTFRQTTVNFTLGVGVPVFTAANTGAPNASTGTAGIAALATQGEVDAGVVTNKIVTPATLAASSLMPKRFSATIGDGTATSYTVTHNLNSLDCTVAVYSAATGAEVGIDVQHTSVNVVTIVSDIPVALNSLKVAVKV